MVWETDHFGRPDWGCRFASPRTSQCEEKQPKIAIVLMSEIFMLTRSLRKLASLHHLCVASNPTWVSTNFWNTLPEYMIRCGLRKGAGCTARGGGRGEAERRLILRFTSVRSIKLRGWCHYAFSQLPLTVHPKSFRPSNLPVSVSPAETGPTPDGVPVNRRSPLLSVVNREQ